MNRRSQTGGGYSIAPNADGPVDHDVPVLRVDGPDGKLRALLFGYACHNTTLDFYQFCGDYAGFAQEYVEEAHPGTDGVVHDRLRRRPESDASPHAGMGETARAGPGQRRGGGLGRQGLATVRGPLRVALDEVSLELEGPPSTEQLKQQAQSTDKYQKRNAEDVLSALEKTGRVPSSYPYLVQVVQFGDDLTMIGLAGEVVVDYSLRLKRELAGAPVWVAGYTNDVFGYVPSRRVLEEGGYEARGAILYYGTMLTPFAPSVEERIIGKVHELVDKVRTPNQK